MDRSRLSREERAKQFIPFSALTGLEEKLKEKEENIGKRSKPILSDEWTESINRKLSSINEDTFYSIIFYDKGEIKTLSEVKLELDIPAKVIHTGSTVIPFSNLLAIHNENIN